MLYILTVINMTTANSHFVDVHNAYLHLFFFTIQIIFLKLRVFKNYAIYSYYNIMRQ